MTNRQTGFYWLLMLLLLLVFGIDWDAIAWDWQHGGRVPLLIGGGFFAFTTILSVLLIIAGDEVKKEACE